MQTLLFENDEIKFELENGILIAIWKCSTIDISKIQKTVRSRVEALNGNSYPLLSNIKSIKNSTKEARDYLASKDGCQGISKAAILISSPVSSMIANFFIKASHPIIPTKMFTNEAEAKNWLLLK